MGDLRSIIEAPEAIESTLKVQTAGDHLEALMDDVLGVSAMAEALVPPSATDTLRQAMDDVMRLADIEPPASVRASLDALDGPTELHRLASDLSLNAVATMADAGMLSAAQSAVLATTGKVPFSAI